jgi:hypothetical protein
MVGQLRSQRLFGKSARGMLRSCGATAPWSTAAPFADSVESLFMIGTVLGARLSSTRWGGFWCRRSRTLEARQQGATGGERKQRAREARVSLRRRSTPGHATREKACPRRPRRAMGVARSWRASRYISNYRPGCSTHLHPAHVQRVPRWTLCLPCLGGEIIAAGVSPARLSHSDDGAASIADVMPGFILPRGTLRSLLSANTKSLGLRLTFCGVACCITEESCDVTDGRNITVVT